jgi:hypothetical protein
MGIREPVGIVLEFAAVKKLAVAVALLALTLPAIAQSPEPQAPAPEPAAKTAPSVRSRFFFGGGVGLAFGAVDYLEIAPLVGFKAAPRLDLGVQPFYRWTNDGRYGTSVEYTDYGARLFARVRIVSNFFAEADYQFTSYEYLDINGGTARASYNAFLAGGGYTVPLGGHAGLYFSALYDFSYDANDPYSAYDSPVQFQVGASVWF